VADIPSSPTLPAVPSVGTASRPTRPAAQASAPATVPVEKPTTGAHAAVSAPAARGATFGLTYSYDEGAHHFVLQARDPLSGFVVFQWPPNYVVKQFSASASATSPPSRGASVDDAV